MFALHEGLFANMGVVPILTAILVVLLLVKLISKDVAPRGIPILGKNIILNSVSRELIRAKQIFMWISAQNKKIGDTFWVNNFGKAMIFTKDAELVNYIYKNRDIFPHYEVVRFGLRYQLGTTMFSEEGEIWQKRHKILQEMLNVHAMRHNTKMVYGKMQTMMDILQKEISESKSVDVLSYIMPAYVDVIGEVAFGVDLHTLDQENSYGATLLESFTAFRIAQAIRFRMGNKNFFPLQTFTKFGKADAKARIAFTSFFQKLLKEREAELANGGEKFESDRLTNAVNSMLFSREKYPGVYHEQDMIAECNSLFGAGYETTANTAAFMLYLLAEHPNVQEKARAEVMTLVNQLGTSTPAWEDLNQLKYMNAIIQETLRLYPGVPVILRDVTRDREAFEEGKHYNAEYTWIDAR